MGSDSLIGAQIGSYRIVQELGRGGMGTVYLGVHPQIESRVAIKVLAEEYLADPSVVGRFFEEARASNLIADDGVVKITDLATLEDGRPYIVMEYLAGQSVSDHLRERRKLTPAEARRIIAPVLRTLSAAHERGIVHRDIKPSNVFLPAEGGVKVLDFGIAKLLPSMKKFAMQTATGVSLGTPAYMAPEQVLGLSVDARADIYAVGVMLFELVTGKRPFGGPDVELSHLQEDAPSPRQQEPGLSDSLERVIARALEKAPEDRFATAKAFLDALMAADVSVEAPREVVTRVSATGEDPRQGPRQQGPTALPPTKSQNPVVAPTLVMTPSPAPRPRRRSFAPWVAAAVVVATLVVAVVVATTTEHEDESDVETIDVRQPRRTKTAKRRSTPIAPPPSSAKSVEPAVPPSRQFDPVAFIPKAVALARTEVAGAELASWTAHEVNDSGRVDLDGGGKGVRYYTVDPASKKCATITVSRGGVAKVTWVGDGCLSKTGIPAARCHLPSVIAVARAKTGRTSPRMEITYWQTTRSPHPIWQVRFGEPDRLSTSVYDDGLCDGSFRLKIRP